MTSLEGGSLRDNELFPRYWLFSEFQVWSLLLCIRFSLGRRAHRFISQDLYVVEPAPANVFYELLGSLSMDLCLLTLADVSLCGSLSRILSVSGLWFPKSSKGMPFLQLMKADRPCFLTVPTQWGIVPQQEECLHMVGNCIWLLPQITTNWMP